MVFSPDGTAERHSRRRLLKNAGAMIAAGSTLTLAGCTDSAASDEPQDGAETKTFEPDELSVDEPSPVGESALGGTTLPDGPPAWIETNMAYQGWYDATAYNIAGWQLDEYHYYIAQRGLFDVRVTRSGETNTMHFGTNRRASASSWGELEIEAVGSNAFLTASFPEVNGYELWISGTLQIETYWIGLL